MRTVGVVTVARSDFGIYRPLLRRIRGDEELHLHLYVGGSHLWPDQGMTSRDIEAEKFEIGTRVEIARTSDEPEGIAESMGSAVLAFARALARFRPDVLVVLGDRFEMHAAALAALPFGLPVAHIHGGEETEGAFDNSLRHSITKLSHLHFVAAETYAQRVIQMGEEPWRVTVSGAPSLDNLREIRRLTREELEAQWGLDLRRPPLLVTFHPATLEYDRTEEQVQELLAALDAVGIPVVFTAPNADTRGGRIRQLIAGFVNTRAWARRVDTLGTQAYFSLMSIAAAMVGNSSSGLIEAPAFRLPAVNIGSRQRGRLRTANVIDADASCEDIRAAIDKAVSPAFRESLANVVNPYGDGHAAETILEKLKNVALDRNLVMKSFWNGPGIQ
jgi:UDP-hydrolysing UDP-N-acetyl-D-glucosamine 2-epimerase